MKSYDISIRFNTEIHIKFIQNQLIYFQDYEDYLFNFLQNPVTRKECVRMLNELDKKKILNFNNFNKIQEFMLNYNKCNEFFTFFDKKSKLPSELNITKESVIDYQICNIRDYNTYKVFTNLCYYAFNQIISSIYPFEKFDLEKLQKNIKSFLESSFIKNEEQLIVFIMIITQNCVKRYYEDNTYNNYTPENEAKCIYALLCSIGKTMKGNNDHIIINNKPKIFSNILYGIFMTFHYDYIKSNINFNQRPYYKLFFNLLFLLNKFKNNELIFNSDNTKITYLTLFAEFFRIITPLSYPGFALAWLDLISCKYFVSPFLEYGLTSKNNRDIIIYEKYLYLVIDLFNFPKYYANEIMVDFSSEIFLKNLYKFIYVLYKSYPEFISNYYYIIIVSLPSGNHFIELKNLILSCGPKEIEKPDPFSDEIDSILPEKKKNASILFDIASILKDYGFKDLITQFIETKNINVVSELCKKLNAHKNRNFNFYVINAIVIYFAQKILRQLQEKKNKKNEIFDFFMKMMEQLESDNRDHLINSILNELRYVSTQTLFFKNLIIYILSEIKNDNIEEQIIGNIFQRLIFKPIPWGLTLTFAQLIKNNKYKLAEKTYFKKANLDESFIKKVKDFIQNESSGNFINS